MAIIKKYRSEVIHLENPISDIYIVTFRSLDKKYKYLPGQFLHLALDEYEPSLPWPESRCFSMQSSNTDETIKITFAIKGKFTARMAKELCEGKIIYLKLPYGELFSSKHSKDKIIFVAGGTGITPFLSLFTNYSFQDYTNPRLYFGFRNQHYYDIYNEELKIACEMNKTLSIFCVDQEKTDNLNIDIIYKENGKDGVYYVSGPPVMIHDFKEYLIKAGVDKGNIITDDWE